MVPACSEICNSFQPNVPLSELGLLPEARETFPSKAKPPVTSVCLQETGQEQGRGLDGDR